MHFSITESEKNKEKWVVCLYPINKPFIDCEFESSEIASKVAEKVNLAYKLGASDTEGKVLSNMKEILFKD